MSNSLPPGEADYEERGYRESAKSIVPVSEYDMTAYQPANPLEEFDLARARERNRNIMEATKWAVQHVFKRGVHYGKYTGWKQDELLQPGGDVIMNLCSLVARDSIVTERLDFGPERPYAYYVARVELIYAAGTQFEEVVAAATAVCHSFEDSRTKRSGYDPQYALNTFNTIYAMAVKRAKLKAVCQVGFLNQMGFTVDIGDTHHAATHKPNGEPNGVTVSAPPDDPGRDDAGADAYFEAQEAAEDMRQDVMSLD